MQKKFIAALVLSNVIFFIILWGYKEKLESKSIEANDYKVFLKEEKEARSRDKNGFEHLQKQVEAIGSGANLKNSPEWMALISEVKGLKASRVLSASKTSLESTYFIKTTVRDSIHRDTLQVECNNYQDDFITLKGCGGEFYISTKDSISQIVYQGKRIKKFLFFRVGARSVQSELTNHNPYSTFTYSKTVIVKKKK